MDFLGKHTISSVILYINQRYCIDYIDWIQDRFKIIGSLKDIYFSVF